MQVVDKFEKATPLYSNNIGDVVKIVGDAQLHHECKEGDVYMFLASEKLNTSTDKLVCNLITGHSFTIPSGTEVLNCPDAILIIAGYND